MQYKRLENIVFAAISLLVGLRILTYYTSILPDFDIGNNEAFITLKCGGLIFALWGIELFLFHCIKVRTDDARKKRSFKTITMLAYWIIVWILCYHQCVVVAMQDWNDMMNGITD